MSVYVLDLWLSDAEGTALHGPTPGLLARSEADPTQFSVGPKEPLQVALTPGYIAPVVLEGYLAGTDTCVFTQPVAHSMGAATLVLSPVVLPAEATA